MLFAVSCNRQQNQKSSFTTLPKELRNNMHLLAQTSYYANEDFTIHETAVLAIEAGVKLTMCDTCHIYCKGAIIAQGTDTNFIEIGAKNKETKLHFTSSKLESSFNNTYFNNTSIYVSRTSFKMDSCHFNEYDYLEKSKLVSFVLSSFNSTVHLSNSFFTGNNLKEGIGFNKGSCTIVNNKFSKHPDAIELSNLESALVKNNQIEYSSDDGIDLNNCKNSLISDNSIRFSKDKGISVGNRKMLSKEQSIKIRNNLISDNKIGIAVKKNALVEIYNCTLSNNEIGLFFSEDKVTDETLVSIVDSTRFKNNKQISNSRENPNVRYSNCFSNSYLPGIGNSQYSN
tara:strand:+ start:435 stop:1460 length:1026 start_codon:yes stop_codon:yes gene_type:complete